MKLKSGHHEGENTIITKIIANSEKRTTVVVRKMLCHENRTYEISHTFMTIKWDHFNDENTTVTKVAINSEKDEHLRLVPKVTKSLTPFPLWRRADYMATVFPKCCHIENILSIKCAFSRVAYGAFIPSIMTVFVFFFGLHASQSASEGLVVRIYAAYWCLQK